MFYSFILSWNKVIFIPGISEELFEKLEFQKFEVLSDDFVL